VNTVGEADHHHGHPTRRNTEGTAMGTVSDDTITVQPSKRPEIPFDVVFNKKKD